jgi:2-oxo-4-hydroxy-4-carboxy--5-ureidoimidazoline (OHCU) decarboxylase
MLKGAVESASSVPGLFSTTKDLTEQITQAAATGRASKQAITALTANPSLSGNIARAADIEKSTGITLPMLAQSNGDTTISSYLQSQIARGENVEFTAAVKRQYETAEQALTKAKQGVAPAMQEVDSYVKKKALETSQKNIDVVNKAGVMSARRKEGLDNIDSRIVELTDTLRTAPSQVDIGTRLTNLIAAKEKMVRGEVGPKYEELIKNSENAGIVLPAKSAAGLIDYVKEEEFKSAFTSFPTLWPKIKKVFADPEEKLYYSLRDLDSLKRETNAALRDSMPGTGEYRILTGLKKQVDAAIDSTDPSFADAYRAIDKEYATRVGMPFNVAGVAQIDRAKFVEQTVPVLTKRASSLKQAMDIIGDSPEGKKIVEDAFLFDIGANRSIISTTTGQLNTPQLKRYIAQNKDKIDMVPGLRDRLEGLGTRVNELKANRTAILDAEKNASIEKIDSLWTQSYGETGGIRGVVRKALTNPAELDKLVSLAGNDNIAKAGIKRAMIEDVLSAQGDRVSLINENKQAFEKVFGKDQAKYIVDIVEASQRLKDNPFAMRININTISKTGWQDLTGSKMETSLGEARNQIMTAPRVFINHLGRYFNNQTDKSEAVEVQKFLLDSNALKDAAEFMTTLNTRGFDERAKNLMGKLMKNSVTNYLFGAITGGIVGSQAETTKSNFDPALLEGFGEVPK